MELHEYAAMRELENSKTEGWGATTALWVIVAVILIFAIVYNWTRNCNEKVEFANGLATLKGQIQCIAPVVQATADRMYDTNGAVTGLVTGVKAQFNCLTQDVNRLWAEVEEGERGCRRGCDGGGHRRFAQTSNYALKDTQVSVTESCVN